jgi:hypothetical protein
MLSSPKTYNIMSETHRVSFINYQKVCYADVSGEELFDIVWTAI